MLRYGLLLGAAIPTTSRTSIARPATVATTVPSSVTQFASSRGKNDFSKRRSFPASSLQGAHVRDQRVDRCRVQLVLVAFHLRAVLLHAVLDRGLDLRVGMPLLPGRRGHVLDLQLLALIGLRLPIRAVARRALRLEITLCLLVHLRLD